MMPVADKHALGIREIQAPVRKEQRRLMKYADVLPAAVMVVQYRDVRLAVYDLRLPYIASLG